MFGSCILLSLLITLVRGFYISPINRQEIGIFVENENEIPGIAVVAVVIE